MKISSRIPIMIIVALFIGTFPLFPQSYLPSSTTNQVIKHAYFTLSYAEDHEQAEWVAYKLTSELLGGTQSRSDNFREDPAVTTGSATLSDYKGSGYDRGHLCPAGDMTFSEEAMSESFFMSNMSPQVPGFNRGIWKELEEQVREWAEQEEEIIVVTGPVFSDNKGAIGDNEVTIPGYYYKVIFDITRPQKMIGFILPNEKAEQPITEFAVSVDSVETSTGIDFFHEMIWKRKERKLEGSFDLSNWTLEADE